MNDPMEDGTMWAVTGCDEWGKPIYEPIPIDTADHWREDRWGTLGRNSSH